MFFLSLFFLGTEMRPIRGGILGRNFPCVTHCHGRTGLHPSRIRDLVIEQPHLGFRVGPNNNAHHGYVYGPGDWIPHEQRNIQCRETSPRGEMLNRLCLCDLRLCFRICLNYPVSPEWRVEPLPGPLEQESASDPLTLSDVAEARREASVERSLKEFAMFQEERGEHSCDTHGSHIRLSSICRGQNPCIRHNDGWTRRQSSCVS